MPRAGPGILIRLDPKFMNVFRQKIERVRLVTLIDFPGEVKEIAQRSLDKVRARTPVDTGRTHDNWFLTDESRSAEGVQRFKIKNRIASSRAGRELLFILEYGSKAHRIVRRRAKALHWERPSGTHHFRREVFHPGTKPFGMLRTTAAEANVEMIGLSKRMAKKMAKIWGR